MLVDPGPRREFRVAFRVQEEHARHGGAGMCMGRVDATNLGEQRNKRRSNRRDGVNAAAQGQDCPCSRGLLRNAATPKQQLKGSGEGWSLLLPEAQGSAEKQGVMGTAWQ